MDTLLKFNDELMGAPSGVLLLLFAVALGYVLKLSPLPNRFIPVAVVMVCTGGFMLIAPERAADMPERIYVGRNFIIGFLLGFAAWTFHAQILKRWLDSKIFSSNTNQDPNEK